MKLLPPHLWRIERLSGPRFGVIVSIHSDRGYRCWRKVCVF